MTHWILLSFESESMKLNLNLLFFLFLYLTPFTSSRHLALSTNLYPDTNNNRIQWVIILANDDNYSISVDSTTITIKKPGNYRVNGQILCNKLQFTSVQPIVDIYVNEERRQTVYGAGLQGFSDVSWNFLFPTKANTTIYVRPRPGNTFMHNDNTKNFYHGLYVEELSS